MNLYNIYYVDLLSGSDEIQAHWRSSHETVEEVKHEIEQKHEWSVIFVERLK